MLSLILIAAAGQGLILCAWLLYERKGNVQANRLLAGLLGVFILLMLHALAEERGVFELYPHLIRSVAAFPLLIGPLSWLYLGCQLEGRQLKRRDLVHGLPFALFFIAWLPLMLGSPGPRPGLAGVIGAAALLKVVHLASYARAGYDILRRVRSPGLNRLSAWLAGGLVLDALVFVVEQVSPSMPIWSDKLGALVLTGFVYGLAVQSLRLPEPDKRRYASSTLDDALRKPSMEALIASMEQGHLYRDGELSLESLAEQLALTTHELSQLINQSCGVNFQEFLNGYRVEALKRALSDPARSKVTILELGIEAGFNSKSAMNRVFKKHTGQTPTTFRRE
ncbi:helix-turn-helix domain-containing protein [Burkholderiaceae bacterium DAT-1]|nr:helix-turn-helix domain-containing protein [Burkholderiaceae bacterium DAT-1]